MQSERSVPTAGAPAGRSRLGAACAAVLSAAARPLIALLSLLPPRLTSALAAPAGSLFYLAARRRRRVALRNLDIAFRSALPAGEKRLIARASFTNLLLTAAGLARRGRRAPGLSDGVFRIAEEDDALLAAPGPEGLAILSAHIGDWEMLHHYLNLRGLDVTAVVRGISASGIDGILARLRSNAGGRIVSKRGALSEIRETLRKGGVVGLMADQNCPRRERFFDFFGVPASTYTEHARILARSRTRVVFVACIRERDGTATRFRIVVRDVGARPPERGGADRAAEVGRAADEIVRRYLAEIEELARRVPEQYLWMHRRWKSRPTGAPWLYGDLGRPLDLDHLALQPSPGAR
jgi:KDO2-lipid IV(A) lauroyltransferase